MKKFFVIICLIFLSIPSWAEYKPIPKELSKQYKAEVEQIILNKSKATKQEINNIFKNARKSYYSGLKNNELYMDFATSNYDTAVFSPIFDLFTDIIAVTEKYADIRKEIPATDSYGTLYGFLKPYFLDNNINLSEISILFKYAESKHKQVEKYYNNAHKIIYPNEH